jgi:Protein of unknown function (DUF1225).
MLNLRHDKGQVSPFMAGLPRYVGLGIRFIKPCFAGWLVPGLVPPRGGLVSLDELVGRLPTVFTNPGTPSSSKRSNVRTVRLRLLPSGSQERKLRRIADATARLWNELNYARLVQYRETGRVDFEDTEHEFYYKYNSVLGVNAGQVINLNNWMWNSYFELLKLYKQGKLPKFMGKPSPPGFWKDKVLGKRTLRILVRNDRYYLEPINNGEGYLVLKDWGLKIKYAGRIKWSGKH